MLRGLFWDDENLKMYFQADFQIEGAGWGSRLARAAVVGPLSVPSRLGLCSVKPNTGCSVSQCTAISDIPYAALLRS